MKTELIVVIPCLKPDFTFTAQQQKSITLLFFVLPDVIHKHTSALSLHFLFCFSSSGPCLSSQTAFILARANHWGIERERRSPFIHCLSLKHLSLSIFWMTSLHCFTLQDKTPVCPTSRSLCLPVSLYVSLPLSFSFAKVNASLYAFSCVFICMHMYSCVFLHVYACAEDI